MSRKTAPPKSGPPKEVNVPTKWVQTEDPPIVFANQFMLQFSGDEYILSAGQLVPPSFTGTPQEIARKLIDLKEIPVRVVSRVAFSGKRLDDLIALLKQHQERVASEMTERK